MTNETSRLEGWWDRLTAPHPDVPASLRLRARMLAVLSLTIAGFALIDLRGGGSPPFIPANAIIAVLALLAYAVGRTRHYWLATGLLLAPVLTASLLLPFVFPGAIYRTEIFLIPIILGSLLLPTWGTIAIAGISIGGMHLVSAIAASSGLADPPRNLLLILLAAVLLTITSWQRQKYERSVRGYTRKLEQKSNAARGQAEESNRRAHELLDAILALSAGDYDRRMPVGKDDHVWSGIATGFNMLAEELAHQVHELQAVTKAVQTADRSKSQFLAAMSHELRTPLNAIIGFSELLEDQSFGPLNERQATYVNNIIKSAHNLLALIDEVLQLSRIDARMLDANRLPVDVAAALDTACTRAQSVANKKKIDLRLEISPDLPLLYTDPDHFQQIVQILLKNAIKFTPEGGEVEVTGERTAELNGAPDRIQEKGAERGQGENGYLQVSVRDTGIGIAPEDLERIFERFEQVEGDYDRRFEGTGLGLSLGRELVDMHGGHIWAESQGKSHGSTFTFVLPFEPARISREDHGS